MFSGMENDRTIQRSSTHLNILIYSSLATPNNFFICSRCFKQCRERPQLRRFEVFHSSFRLSNYFNSDNSLAPENLNKDEANVLAN